MQYKLAFRYIIDRPGGFNNLLLITVCVLIPVIGPIILLGYQSEVVKRLLPDPRMKDHPAFTFDRFSEYLQKGIWPFVVQLIVNAAVMFLVMLLGWLPMVIFTMLQVPVVGVIILVAVVLVGTVAGVLLAWPAVLYALYAQKFDFPGTRGFVAAFWRTLGAKAFVSVLVFWLIGTALTLVGLLLCFVGVYPAAALVQMAAAHLMVQHYRMYLDAGGTPIGEAPPATPSEPEVMELD